MDCCLSPSAILAIGVIVLTSLYWYVLRRPKRFPPGPKGLPFIGALSLLSRNKGRQNKLFMDLSKKYNSPIIGIPVAQNYMVVLNDLKSIKEAFLSKGLAFCDRAMPLSLTYINKGRGLIPMRTTSMFLKHRDMVIQTLHHMTAKEVYIDEYIDKAVTEFRTYLGRQTNRPFQLDVKLGESLLRSLIHVFCGYQCTLQESERLFSQYDHFTLVPSSRFMVNASSFLRNLCKYKWFRKFCRMQQDMEKRDEIRQFFIPILADVQEKLKGGAKVDMENPQNIMECYTQQQTKITSSEEKEFFKNEQIIEATIDLVLGSLASSQQIYLWGMLLLSVDESIQDKMFIEIQRELGQQRLPTIQDMERMPICMATLYEIFRYSVLISLGVPHTNAETAELGGFIIPANTLILANLYAVTRDPTIFKKPHSFDPLENFYDSETKKVIHHEEANYVFSVGPRYCFGAKLATILLFKYLVGVVQKFRISLPSGQTKIQLDCPYDALRKCTQTVFVFRPR